MVIPQRDWLLLRGRMRAVAKIPVLPMLLDPTRVVAEQRERDEDDGDKREEKLDA